MALQNLRSNTANKRPTASGMVDGQVAINTNATNPGLFFKDAGDGIRKVGPVFIGSSAPNSSPAAGGSTGHSIGEQWLDTSGSRYVVKTYDGTAWRDDDSNYLQLTGGALSGALTIDNAANVAALDLKFDGDNDTGFYAPAANTLGFVSGGTERVRIDSSGRIGIGTTSPGFKLEVNSNTSDSVALFESSDTTARIILRDNGSTSGGYVGVATEDMFFHTDGNERLRIDSSGNVGIGTSSPSYPLHVNGNAQFGTGSAWRTDTDLFKSTTTSGANIRSATGSASTPTYSLVGDEDTGVYFPQANAVAVSTGGSQRLLIDSLGRVGINTTANQADLDVNGSGAGTIRIGSSSTSRSVITHVNNASNSYLLINVDEGNNSAANTHFKIWVDGSERLRIDSSGNVGIGVTNPGSFNAKAETLVLANGGDHVGITLDCNTDKEGSIYFADGSTGDNLLRGQIVYNHSGDSLRFVTNASEQMRIDSAGDVGIGTTNPAYKLTVEGTIAGTDSGTRFIRLFKDGTVPKILTGPGQPLEIGADDDSHLRIDTDGDIGIGTLSPSTKLHVAGTTRIGANDTTSAILEIGAGATGNRNAYIDLVGDTTYSDFGLRIIRNNSGPNTTSTIDHRGTGPLELKTREASPLVFITSGTERARITSDGKFLIGFTSRRANFNNASDAPQLQLEATSYVGSAISAVRNSNNAAAGALILGKTRGTAVNSNTVVQSNDALGQISFQGADGSELVEAAKITANIDAPPGANDMPGRLVFMTTANGASSPSERMRIRENGKIGIGTTTPESTLEISRSLADDNTDLRIKNFRPGIRFIDISSSASDAEIVMDGGALRFRISEEVNASTALTERMRLNSSGQLGVGTASPTKKLHVNGEAFVTGNTFFHSTNSSAILAGTAIGKYFQTDGNLISGKTTTNGNTHQAFCNPNGIVGTIRTSGSATQYNTSSDYRLKENVVDIADGITRVKQLQPRRFNFIADADTIVDGFIAHEAQTIVPEAVSGTHNEVDEDGKAVMQGIDQSKLVPLLTAALKEAIAKIETLETRVAALEAG
jgi:hypothetical protein